MKDEYKTKKQLIVELEDIRRGIAGLKVSKNEHKQGELEKEHIRLCTILEYVSDGVAVTDIELRITDINEVGVRMFGYNHKGEIIGRSGLKLISPKDHARAMVDMRNTIEKGHSGTLEYTFLDKKGREFLAEYNVIVIKNESGSPVGFVATMKDVTERKKVENELRKFKTIADKAGYGVTICDPEGTNIYVNLSYASMHGYTPDELIGKHISFSHTEQQMAKMNELMGQLKSEGNYVAGELWHKRKDGTEFPTLMTATFIRDEKGAPLYMVGTALDITERKQAEKELREAELKYRIVADNTYDWEWWLSPAGEFIYVSPSCSHITGYNAFEFRNNAGLFQNIIHPDDLHVWDNHRCETSQDKVATTIEFRILHKDGSEHWIEHICQPVFDDTGKFQGSRGSNRDITERRQAEELFRNLADSSPIGIYIIQDGGFKYVNSQFQKQTGYSEVELLGLEPMTIVVPEDRVKVREHTIRMLKGNSSDSYEYRAIDKAGNTQWVLETVAPIMYNEKRAAVGNQMVITERKQLEAERQRVEKLESIDTLAAGIAHDFNNLLTGIMGNISLAKRHIEPEGKALERLEEAEKASIRARDLTQQLLTFTRGGVPVRKIISIGQLILESANFALRGSNVRPKFSLPDGLWMVEADEGQINQVINNIVINADQAMPQGGTINIKVKNQVITSRAALPLPNGNYVEIIIKDQGVGILKEHLDRIFDPFFTTKQKGSGLGLATAYSIINNHGGYITVESKLGVGTTLYIYLPASKVKTPIEEKTISETPLVGKGRILVMDDEESIQELLHAELTEAGYDVDLTHDGTEAIKQYKGAKEAGQPFDLVILDLTIPGGVGGKETIKKLLEIDPKVKAIVSSGYATDPIISEYKKYGFSSMVPKPYSVSQLEKTIQDLLKK